MGKTRKYISLVVLIILLALYLGSTLGNEWLIYDTDHVGLWQICRQNQCSWMEYTPSYLVAFLDWYSCVRAFLILSCIFTFMALCVQGCNIYSEVHFHITVVRSSAVMAVICDLIGVVVYACSKDENYEEGWGFGWTFYLACVAGILNILLLVYLYTLVEDQKRSFQPINVPPPLPPLQVAPPPLIPDIPLVEIPAASIDSKNEKNETGSSGRPPSILSESKKSSKKGSVKGSVKFETGSKSSVMKDDISSSDEGTLTETATGTETVTGTYDDDASSYTSRSSYTSEGSGTLISASTTTRGSTNLSGFV